MELVRVAIADDALHGDRSVSERAGWAIGETFSVPAEVFDRDVGVRRFATSGIVTSLPALAAVLSPADATALREARSYIAASDRPASSRLPFSYQRIPGPVRAAVASLIGRYRARQQGLWAKFPGWPLDLSADFLASLTGASEPVKLEGKTPVILSHDLDSAEGIENAVRYFLPIEEAVGARSSNFIVPKGWPLDYARIDEIRARGHEIGIHGYDHANLTAHAEPQTRRMRLDAASDLIERYGSIGYRAPSLMRSPELLADLAGRYRYDSSIPTSGGLFPAPNNGSATARPYRIGDLWELPLSMPRDGSLRFLGMSPAAILDLWKISAGRISAAGGAVVLLTHCERRFSGEPKMLQTYEAFVRYIKDDERFVFTRPAELLDSLGGTDPGRAPSRHATA